MAEVSVTGARFPTVEQRSLVYWTGDKGGPALPLVDRNVTSAIALSLANAGRNQQLIDDARARGLHVMLDGEAWRGQLARDHRMRKSWSPAGLQVDEVVDPDAGEFDPTWRAEFTEAFIDAQVEAGGTILTTPAHFSVEPTGVARRNDYLLARAAVDYVERRRLRQTAPGAATPLPRQLYATITVKPTTLSDEVITKLVEGYARLRVDGFMLWAFKFGSTARQFKLVRRVAMELQRMTGQPVVVGGLGHMWKLALASGVASACFGHQRSELGWPPPVIKEPRPGEERTGFGVPVYHPDIFGGFKIGQPGEAQRSATFSVSPCECGHHPAPTQPPADHAASLAHNVAMTMAEARIAVSGSPAQAVGRMVSRVSRASRRRALLGMSPLPSGWRLKLAEDFPDLVAPGEEQIL